MMRERERFIGAELAALDNAHPEEAALFLRLQKIAQERGLLSPHGDEDLATWALRRLGERDDLAAVLHLMMEHSPALREIVEQWREQQNRAWLYFTKLEFKTLEEKLGPPQFEPSPSRPDAHPTHRRGEAVINP